MTLPVKVWQEGSTMPRYQAKWTVEFDAENDAEARRIHADLLDQSDAVEAEIWDSTPIMVER